MKKWRRRKQQRRVKELQDKWPIKKQGKQPKAQTAHEQDVSWTLADGNGQETYLKAAYENKRMFV